MREGEYRSRLASAITPGFAPAEFMFAPVCVGSRRAAAATIPWRAALEDFTARLPVKSIKLLV